MWFVVPALLLAGAVVLYLRAWIQIEFIFNPPPRFVGDLAVTQQLVDEIALGRDQFQLERRRPAHLIETLGQVGRQDLHAAIVARAQMVGRFIG